MLLNGAGRARRATPVASMSQSSFDGAASTVRRGAQMSFAVERSQPQPPATARAPLRARACIRPAGRVLCGLIVCALALTGCGSVHADRRIPADAAAPTTTSLPTPAPIPIGTVCSCSGPLRGASAVVGAWVAAVNAATGIDGHPLQLFAANDHGSASASVADVQRLVEVDHVVAIVGEASLQAAHWAAYLQSVAVPVVGGISFSPAVAASPDYFPSAAPLAMQAVGAVALARRAGADHLGVLVCAKGQSCDQLASLADGAAALLGIRKVTRVLIHTGPGGLTKTCGGLRASGVDALLIASATPVAPRLVGACARIAYMPLLVGLASLTPSSWLRDPLLYGMLLASPNADATDSALPAIRSFRSALRRYAPSLLTSAPVNPQLLGPWTGGLLFAAAAAADGAGGVPSAAALRRGLLALHGETLDGLSPPLSFAAKTPAVVPCYFAVQVALGQLLPLDHDRPRCVARDRAAALINALTP
jgi:branched-chain amino acid transport system substrate-binding protein